MDSEYPIQMDVRVGTTQQLDAPDAQVSPSEFIIAGFTRTQQYSRFTPIKFPEFNTEFFRCAIRKLSAVVLLVCLGLFGRSGNDKIGIEPTP